MTRRPATLPARAMAAQVVADVLHGGRSLTPVLEQALTALPPSSRGDTSLIQEMAYGTLRWAIALQAQLQAFLKKPLKAKDQDIHALLLVGLYQLTHMQVAPHAAVTETVSAAGALGKEWAKHLVNAVLRNFLRLPAPERAGLLDAPHLVHSHPPWLLQQLRGAWPDHWMAICDANNTRPPLTLRVNRQKTTRDDYRALLAESGIAATPTPHTDDGLTLTQSVPVTTLPGFQAGHVSVQDGAAQLAAVLLDAPAGAQVLDACAAPGGKACHVLERTPSVGLVAVDLDPRRLQRVAQNLARLGQSATLITGDATTPAAWWQGPAFDRILLDAPCSATGVIRRHPDIKHHRTEQDLVELPHTQARLLEALWPWLAPGGKLLYVTCSILPLENEYPIRDFLARHGDAAPVPLPLTWAHATGHGYQILPGEEGMDGFYYACVRKLPGGGES